MLRDYGIDDNDGLSRCLNNEDLYLRVLSVFLKDKTLAVAAEAEKNQNRAAMFAAMHELKGACGNAGMTELYHAVTPLVEMLRPGKTAVDDAAVSGQLEKVKASYEKAWQGITALLATV